MRFITGLSPELRLPAPFRYRLRRRQGVPELQQSFRWVADGVLQRWHPGDPTQWKRRSDVALSGGRPATRSASSPNAQGRISHGDLRSATPLWPVGNPSGGSDLLSTQVEYRPEPSLSLSIVGRRSDLAVLSDDAGDLAIDRAIRIRRGHAVLAPPAAKLAVRQREEHLADGQCRPNLVAVADAYPRHAASGVAQLRRSFAWLGSGATGRQQRRSPGRNFASADQ